MGKGHKFTLDSKEIFSHLVLSNHDIAMQVAETKQWKVDREMECQIHVNGIEIPAIELSELLMRMWDDANTNARKLHDTETFEAAIEKRAQEIVKEHTDNVIEKMHNLINVIDDPENIITPTWERNIKSS